VGYRITLDEPLDAEVRRVASEQVRRALEDLADTRPARGVHETRKRLKMLRALARLVRRQLGTRIAARENERLRDAGRRLSEIRDGDVLVSTLDGLRSHLRRRAGEALIAETRKTLVHQRAWLRATHIAPSVELGRSTLQAFRASIHGWTLDGLSLDDLALGVARSYGRGRRAFDAARRQTDDETLHEWRKRGKDLWYHLRLVRDAWPGVTDGWIDEAHRLSGLLGDDHDLAVLAGVIESASGEPSGKRLDPAPLRTAILARRAQIREEAMLLGLRMFAEKRRVFRDRLSEYMDAWARERAAA